MCGVRGHMQHLCASVQFCCKPKMSLKRIVYFVKDRMTYTSIKFFVEVIEARNMGKSKHKKMTYDM